MPPRPKMQQPRTLARSLAFIVNRGLQIKYAQALRKICRTMVTQTGRELVQFYERWFNSGRETISGEAVGLLLDELQDRYGAEFDAVSHRLAEAMVQDVFDFSQSSYKSRIADILPKPVKENPLMLS
ncbi:MAG: hypothetical protein J6W10_03665, partial [Kiritimatiellae bacterium]|nr:hypothetical protein [Kiritimatiellia bacterium]